jgi:DNA invertase Pin-like site-specific DNA recombinase
LRVAIYCRISDDRDGEGLGVERQREDCIRRAEREGWEIVEVFIDNDISASTKSRKPRPDYKKMMKLAEDGAFDIILSYSASRLTRRPMELEQLISLHERKNVLLRTIVSGDTNLATADGRATARTLAAWDAAEAERIGERVARKARERAEQGKWHGGTPAFGYCRAPDDKGRLIVDPERAEIVREVAKRLLNGETLYSVCMSLNGRGVPTGPSSRTPGGSRWHSRTLKRVVTAPAVVGLSSMTHDETGEYLPGSWDPILDRRDWERLRTILSDESRGTRESWLPAHKYVLSGLLKCGREGCGRSLTSNTERKANRAEQRISYICNPATNGCGKIRINGTALETFVVRQMLALMDVPPVRTALSTREERADDDELRHAIREDERRLQRLEDRLLDDLLDEAAYRRQRARIAKRLTENREALAKLQRTTFLVDLGGRTLRQAWDDHRNDLGWRRTLLRHVIERIVILPHPVGVASTLPRRKGESDDALAARRREHDDMVLLQRVRIGWKEERLPEGVPDVANADDPAFADLSHTEKVALWASRMHANQPVQLTDPAVVGDVAALVKQGRQNASQ